MMRFVHFKMSQFLVRQVVFLLIKWSSWIKFSSKAATNRTEKNSITLGSTIAIWLINRYRANKRLHARPVCRFTPSCSEYLIMAIHKYGLWKGLQYGGRRLKKCVPFGASGFDFP